MIVVRVLQDGTTDKLFHSLYEPIISRIVDVYSPGAIVLQCGADSLAADRLGNFSMTIAGVLAPDGSRIDREIPNIQDYFLGLFKIQLGDCGKHWPRPSRPFTARNTENGKPLSAVLSIPWTLACRMPYTGDHDPVQRVVQICSIDVRGVCPNSLTRLPIRVAFWPAGPATCPRKPPPDSNSHVSHHALKSQMS